jgi:glycosyltransferase involved in cell wall biosynthesis
VNPRVVLLATGLERGGAETQVRELAARLAGRGWEVSVISLAALSNRDHVPERFSIPIYSLGLRPGSANPLALARLLALLRRLRPHILHAHLFHANLVARAGRLLSPVPVVISTIHSLAESHHTSGNIRFRDWAYRATGVLTDATVCVCQAAADRHLAARAVTAARLHVIPNGVDTERFRPDAAARERTRRELGLGGEFVWLASGRLMWKKDYPTMLRAMARQAAGVLLVAGAGPQESELKALAGELQAKVRFLGERADVPALLNAADGLLLSSVVEGLPLALLEAAAAGLPAVATDAGGVREAVLADRTGLVVPPGDAEAFAAAMGRIVSLTSDERAAMGRAAREHACASFDWQAVAGQWESLYRELLEAAGRRSHEWM